MLVARAHAAGDCRGRTAPLYGMVACYSECAACQSVARAKFLAPWKLWAGACLCRTAAEAYLEVFSSISGHAKYFNLCIALCILLPQKHRGRSKQYKEAAGPIVLASEATQLRQEVGGAGCDVAYVAKAQQGL